MTTILIVDDHPAMRLALRAQLAQLLGVKRMYEADNGQTAIDAVRQFTDRAVTLAINGHPVDKIELLVLGGTWTSYPQKYQEQFCRDLFYAANTFHDRPREKRRKWSLAREKATLQRQLSARAVELVHARDNAHDMARRMANIALVGGALGLARGAQVEEGGDGLIKLSYTKQCSCDCRHMARFICRQVEIDGTTPPCPRSPPTLDEDIA